MTPENGAALDDGATLGDGAALGDVGAALDDANADSLAGVNRLATRGVGGFAHCTSVAPATIMPISMAIDRMKDVNWG